MKLAWVRWEDHWKSLVGLPPVMVIKSGSLDHLDTVCIYIYLVGGLEPWIFLTFQKELGMSPSQLTNSFFQRGWNHQPVYIYIWRWFMWDSPNAINNYHLGMVLEKSKPLWWWFWDGFVFLFSTLYSWSLDHLDQMEIHELSGKNELLLVLK